MSLHILLSEAVKNKATGPWSCHAIPGIVTKPQKMSGTLRSCHSAPGSFQIPGLSLCTKITQVPCMPEKILGHHMIPGTGVEPLGCHRGLGCSRKSRPCRNPVISETLGHQRTPVLSQDCWKILEWTLSAYEASSNPQPHTLTFSSSFRLFSYLLPDLSLNVSFSRKPSLVSPWALLDATARMSCLELHDSPLGSPHESTQHSVLPLPAHGSVSSTSL